MCQNRRLPSQHPLMCCYCCSGSRPNSRPPRHHNKSRSRVVIGLGALASTWTGALALQYPQMSFVVPRRTPVGYFQRTVRRRSPRLYSTPPTNQFGTSIDSNTSSIKTNTNKPVALESSFPSEKYWQRAFAFDVPEGLCVGVQLNELSLSDPASLSSRNVDFDPDHWIRQLIHPKEVEYGIELKGDKIRKSFFAGRIAMRYALAAASSCYVNGIKEMVLKQEICDLPSDEMTTASSSDEEICLPRVSMDEPCILKDSYGRPMVPPGFLGSISHKENIGVALVAKDTDRNRNDGSVDNTTTITKGVGIDIEKIPKGESNVERKVLTPNERENLGNIEGISRAEEVLLRFSLKESVYKAMHPLINQYVGFQEAEITPNPDGTAHVQLNLKSGKHENFGEITANWRFILGRQYFLSSSSVTLKDR